MQPSILPTIFTATGNYTPAVIKMTEATEGLGVASKSAARSMGLLSVSANGVAMSGFSFLRGSMGVLALGTGLFMAGKEAMDFGQQMGNIATLVDTSTESIDAMGRSVLKMGTRGGIAEPISDLTESLYQVRSAGVSAADAMNVLDVSGKLAMAGLSSVTDATKAETSALVAFSKQGLSANQIANSFFLTVKEGKTKMDAINESFGANAGFVASLGVKLQDFNALTAALTITGQTASEAQNGIAASLVGLEKPTSEMTKLYKQLGVSTGRDLINKMGNVGDAIAAVTNAAAKANVEVPKLFSRNALKTVSNITGGANNAYKKNLKEQLEGENALNEAYDKQSKTDASQFQIFKNGITQLGISIGGTLLPALNGLITVLNPVMEGLAWIGTNHKPEMQLLLMGGAVYGLNKAFGIYNGLLKANAFLSAFAAVKSGKLTGALLETESGINGAKLAMGGFNTLIKRSVFWITLLVSSYESMLQTFDANKKENDFERKINPLGLNFNLGYGANESALKKYGVNSDTYNEWQKKYQEKRIKFFNANMGGGGPIGDAVYNSFKKSPLLDSLPKNNSDSALFQLNKVYKDTILPKSNESAADTSTAYNFIPPQDGAKSKTDELLAKIYDVLKSNPQAVMQPAYAGNGQSAKRVLPTIYPTFSA